MSYKICHCFQSTQLHVGTRRHTKKRSFCFQQYNTSEITHTKNRLTAIGPGLPRWVGTRRNTHSHPSWSSDILYQLPSFTTIHSILCVQFMCLTFLFDNLSPGPLWSSSWSWTLYFIHHAFLHPVIIFSQHMPIPTQTSSHNQWYVLIGKQWYQLPEIITTNSNSGLHSCISLDIHTQHVT